MTIELTHVVPWGRTLDEYTCMFGLTSAEIDQRILGCGDGPASFNAEATALGWQVVSCDPLYAFSAEQIRQRVHETYDLIVAEVARNADTFVWDRIPSPDALGALRLQAMERFLTDFEQGQADGRYVTASLPSLPFEEDSFDVALCSHFLFLYADQFDLAFHIQAVAELLRVSAEVRIFPLLGMDGRPSPHVDGVMATLANSAEIHVEQRPVDYEFQKGGNQMLLIRKERT